MFRCGEQQGMIKKRKFFGNLLTSFFVRNVVIWFKDEKLIRSDFCKEMLLKIGAVRHLVKIVEEANESYIVDREQFLVIAIV